MMTEARTTFLPAAGHDLFLPLYDPLTKLLGADRARRELLDQAALRPGDRLLDIGCGTGSLLLMVRRLFPEVAVVGLDPDPKALARARRKAEREAASIELDQGFADSLPYPDASFDRVLSSMMFHHLEGAQKEKTLSEARRVLKPGGSLHLLDFAGPEDSDGFLARLFHSSHRLQDNTEGRILGLMSRAGFAEPKKVGQGALLFLRVAYYRAPVASEVRSA
jgi:ubiquinone/menaquinone biosynthesis C-methylase UbiE